MSVTLLKLFLYVSFLPFMRRRVFSSARISFSAFRILASSSSPSLWSSSLSWAAWMDRKCQTSDAVTPWRHTLPLALRLQKCRHISLQICRYVTIFTLLSVHAREREQQAPSVPFSSTYHTALAKVFEIFTWKDCIVFRFSQVNSSLCDMYTYSALWCFQFSAKFPLTT